jgi:hypothetical protein
VVRIAALQHCGLHGRRIRLIFYHAGFSLPVGKLSAAGMARWIGRLLIVGSRGQRLRRAADFREGLPTKALCLIEPL